MPKEPKKRKEDEQQPQNQPMQQEEPPMDDSWRMQRQSAPQPTAEDEAARLIKNQMTQGGTNAMQIPVKEKIGTEEVRKAYQILQEYKKGKANLERRLIENEQWYKIRHWECMRDKKQEVQPSSAWLFNCIANKHASAMDNFPSPTILPREEGDKGEAERLTSIIPVILDQNDFEETYDSVWTYKLRGGTGVYGVFWDSTKLNGLGDVSIQKCDLINLFWEPGITNIQESANLFHVNLVDNELLLGQFPQLSGKLGTSTLDISKYVFDDDVDTSKKSAVIDWYYKKQNGSKTILHYCKFVNDVVLFATENKPEFATRGWYDHGLYPFEFDVLFPMEGTPCGFGFIDVGKDCQAYIDRGNAAIMANMLANAKPRHFIRSDGSVNEKEYADLTKDFIHVDGNLGQDSIMPVNGKPLNDIYVAVINNKIDELKETTGNRDISTGGSTSGVTAASAIAAMQEAGSKLDRDSSKSAYRAYRRMILMVIELIRQFYDLPRCFRIMGENGTLRYITYSNAGIKPQRQGMDFGIDMGVRVPLFDIEVSAQKSSPYSKMAQNELALQFFNAGMFNPQLADQALVCLDMMDFERKEFIIQKIAQNGGMYQQMMMMQQQMMQLGQLVDAQRGGNEVTAGLAAQFGMQPPPQISAGGAPANVEGNENLGGSESKGKESPVTKKARQRVADSTSPT